MKKILSTVAAAAVLATSSFASDVNFDANKAYLSAGVALEMVDNMDMGVALVLGGGIPFMKAGPGTLAVEGELTYSVMAPSYDDSMYGTSFSSDTTFMTLGAYAGYIYDINPQMFVKPRVGLIYKSADVNVNIPGYGSGSETVSEIGLAVGVQGGYRLNKQLDLTVGLNLVDGMDIMHITGGVQYHF